MNRIVLACVAALALLVSTVIAKPILSTLEGKVIGVTDGDTLTLLVDSEEVKVRLEGIDAPESTQAFGNKAKEHLKSLVISKDAKLKRTGKDKYGRMLGYLYIGGKEINLQMVEDGFAWHFKEYNDQQRFADAEQQARDDKKGLWADSKPMPPWEFRDRKKYAGNAKPSGEVKKPATANPLQDAIPSGESYWLNTSTGVRHNATCKHYKNTKSGRSCTKSDGKPCGICGG